MADKHWGFAVTLCFAAVVMLWSGTAVGSTFGPQVRLGCTVGDQWEPSIAADQYRHVYVLYPQYNVVPGCSTCPSPTMILVISNDNGKTWQAPKQIAPSGSGQWDAQVAVDPINGRTVYASWLQNNKSTVVVAKSTDYGMTWSTVIANSTLDISESKDGGATWSLALLDVSGAPPDCSADYCGLAYLGAQITMTSDAAGTLYALWNAGAVDFGPERIYL